MAESAHGVFSWLVILVGGLVVLVGVGLVFGFILGISLCIVFIGAVARAMAIRRYKKAAKARDLEEMLRLNRESHNGVVS
jgi:hypothetical protein